MDQSFHSMQVVKREEKETSLTQFVLGEIAAGRVSLAGHWSVIAVSMESPVIAALRRVINDLGSAPDLRMSIVLTGGRKLPSSNGFEGIQSLAIRTAQSSRMLDAHEQMVLGEVSSWTGDCMRRDPRERDAFETFGSDNAELSGWAQKAFVRIWGNAAPVVCSGQRSGRKGAGASLNNVVAGEGVKSNVLVAATSRH